MNLRQVAYRALRAIPKLTAPLTLAYMAGVKDPLVLNFVAITRAKLTEAAD